MLSCAIPKYVHNYKILLVAFPTHSSNSMLCMLDTIGCRTELVEFAELAEFAGLLVVFVEAIGGADWLLLECRCCH